MTLAHSKPEPRWNRRKGARPNELINAALEVFAERGFAATRLEDVAKQAGVSKGTVYLYFDSKEDLFKAVVREALVPLVEQGRQTVTDFQGSTAQLLRDLIKVWWNRIGSTRIGAIPKLIIAEAGNFPELARFYHDEVVVRAKDLQRAIIQRGVDSGEFRASDVEYVVHVMSGPLLMLALWRHSFDQVCSSGIDPERYLNTHIDLLLHGLLKTHSAGD